MHVVVIGLNHKTAPVSVRERFALDETRVPAALAQFRASGVATEAVIVSTCNRVEVYAATEHEPAEAWQRLTELLCAFCGNMARLDRELYAMAEPASIEHLFKVACGLDSMVLGETEILGQLKRAYALAFNHGHAGPVLNMTFQSAFNAAKHVRTHTHIQRGSVSVASVAVDLAAQIFGSLCGRTVLVIGAGDTGEKAASALISRGAKCIIANRSPERAQQLATRLSGRAIEFGAWSDVFDEVDIVISSTGAPHYVLDSDALDALTQRRRSRPLLIIDVAVPRDIDPQAGAIPNVFLFNIDDLQCISAQSARGREAEVAKCEQIISARVDALLKRLARREAAVRAQ
ncbi:MAG: glutamyl-tRNA reductase [Verrucomicrobiae bacterium]|nr:glutamyl-tRNA reductase [Verrucomicrobiae bacterium]MCX7721438.1 glutamyl-tRNA reductase [Verrucomicrobiae bacterium]MDW7980396.1 glutamyl-tRNA reductase [Verrucomicrobiales bacterium]